MSVLEELIYIVNLAEGSSLSEFEELHEKIVSKKAQKRKRKKALAAKRQKMQQNKTNKQIDNEKEQDIKADEKQQTTPTHTALIVYDETVNKEQDPEPTELTEAFKAFLQDVGQIIAKYQQEEQKAGQLWEAVGKDKPCPPDAYEALKNCYEGITKDIEGLMQKYYKSIETDMSEMECQFITEKMDALNCYVEKKMQLVSALHPEELQGEDVEQTAIEGEKQLLLTGTVEEPEQTKPEKIKKEKEDKKKQRNIITYDKWLSKNKALNNVFPVIGEVIKKILGGGLGVLKALLLSPTKWLGDNLWATLKSPLANDIVKTFMYSNPITAMIFDGELGKFGFPNILGSLQNLLALKRKQKEDKKPKKDPQEYDERKLLKSTDKLSPKRIKQEFYGNKDFVELVNIQFNHPEVAQDDKQALYKYCSAIKRQFGQKQPERQPLLKSFKSLLTIVNEICDYMEWNTPKDWKKAKKEIDGLTDKEYKQIKKKDKSSKEDNNKNADKEKMASLEDRIKELEAALGNKQESYTVCGKLNALFENYNIGDK